MITRRIIGGILIAVILCVFCLRSCCVILHNKEARTNLCRIYQLQTAYKAMFGHYTDNLYACVFIQDTLVTEGGEANYRISLLEATDSTFVATAVSVVDFDRDGQINTWTVNEMGIITEIVKD